MSETLMSVLLIGISGILLFAILGWEMVTYLTGKTPSSVKYRRLKHIHNFYKLVLLLFIVSSCGYLLLPALRPYFGPLHLLDNDYVNGAGFIILTLAFILIIRAQKRLDREFHLYYADTSSQAKTRLVPNTENHLLGYILLVYAGMFIVVSTIANLLLLAIALIGWYIRYNNRKYKTPTQLQ